MLLVLFNFYEEFLSVLQVTKAVNSRIHDATAQVYYVATALVIFEHRQ